MGALEALALETCSFVIEKFYIKETYMYFNNSSVLGFLLAVGSSLWIFGEATTRLAYAEDAQVYRYEVKGVIKQLPASAREEIFIRHAPIPDYVDETGAKVGMHAMTMPFWLAEGVSMAGISVGDSVQFTFESRWKPKASDKITKIEKVAVEGPNDAPVASEHH